MTFTPTDLPEPVVPATSKCGILAKSTITGLPEISAPNTMVNDDSADWNDSPVITSLSRTISRFLFGSSKPITDLPGITSTTRTEIADIARAKSFDSAVILLTLTPGAKSNSKRVITGPGYTPTTVASILKSASFCSTNRDTCSSSSGDIGFSCLSGRSSKSNEGIGVLGSELAATTTSLFAEEDSDTGSTLSSVVVSVVFSRSTWRRLVKRCFRLSTRLIAGTSTSSAAFDSSNTSSGIPKLGSSLRTGVSTSTGGACMRVMVTFSLSSPFASSVDR